MGLAAPAISSSASSFSSSLSAVARWLTIRDRRRSSWGIRSEDGTDVRDMLSVHKSELLDREQSEKTGAAVVQGVDQTLAILSSFRKDRSDVRAAIDERALHMHSNDASLESVVTFWEAGSDDGDLGCPDQVGFPGRPHNGK